MTEQGPFRVAKTSTIKCPFHSGNSDSLQKGLKFKLFPIKTPATCFGMSFTTRQSFKTLKKANI